MSKKEKPNPETIRKLRQLRKSKEFTDFLLTIEQRDLDNIFDHSMNEMVKELINDRNRFES